ncbi:hypothetical protein [Brevundimonas aurifodinae]|uniref:Uncharacterized protein n=1 Tax=Brevundimonas aurifodinae TaxID=1508312 RepID=A0ABV1NS46_9CAUL
MAEVCLGSNDEARRVVEKIRAITDRYGLAYYDDSQKTASSYAAFREYDPTFYYAEPVINVTFRGKSDDVIVGNLLPRDRVVVIGFSRSADSLSYDEIEREIIDAISKEWTVVELGEGVGATGDQCA